MKKEKTFIKTNIKTKSIILFLMFSLFCIFGISSCADDLPTNSASEISNGNNTVKIKTNLPTFDNNYFYLKYFNISSAISYKDTASLTKLWLSAATNANKLEFMSEELNKEKFKFAENGDLYWIKDNNPTLIKKFHGGTMIILKDGKYSNANGVGGVYTYAISRDEAKSKGSRVLNMFFGINGLGELEGNDGGGKVGKVEILVFSLDYIKTEYYKKYNYAHTRRDYYLQSYNKPEDDNISKYLGELKPEDTMPSLGYWNILIVLADSYEHLNY